MSDGEHEPARAGRSAGSTETQRPASANGLDGESSAQNLGEVMGQIARTLQEEHGDVEATLQAITAAAVDAIPGCDSGSISTVIGRRVRSQAPTSELASTVDALQGDAGEGPCLDALQQNSTVRVDDFRSEDRWPRFAKMAFEHGASSALSFQLFVEGDTLGALNLYGTEPYAFGEESETIGLVFASHAAIAFSAARQEQNLHAAIDRRDLIGQAKGILMERHRLTADQAFHVLVRASSRTNRKLFDIADELTSTGALPEN